MEYLTVIALILAGTGFIIAELVFLPGGVTGIFGLILTGTGVYLGYDYFGVEAGTWILCGAIVVIIGSVVYALQSGTWSRFSLKTSMNSRVNDEEPVTLEKGQEGKTISSLRPMGKAEFGDRVYEVTTTGNFLEAGRKVKIIKVQGNKIVVEPLS